MAVRRVELQLISTGFEDAFAKLDKLSLKLDEIKRKFDEFSKKTLSPNVKLDGLTKADAKLDDLNVKLDKIGSKSVTAKVGVKVDGSAIKKALSALIPGGGGGGKNVVVGGGGGGGGGVSGLLSSVGGANNAYTGAAIAAAIVYAMSLLPSLVPLALGLAVGGGAGAGAFAIGAKDNAQLQALEKSASTAKGKQKQSLLAQIADLKKSDSGFLGLFGGGEDIAHNAESVFLKAITQRGNGGEKLVSTSGATGFEKVKTPSFLQGITGILSQVAGFTKSIGPGLGDMFRASLPFLNMFTKSMEYLAKLLLPVFTQSMKNLTPFLPQIEAGFNALSQGLAYFIKDLGPGMKDSSIIFRATMIAVKGILITLAYTADGLAIAFVHVAEFTERAADDIRDAWDHARRWTATAFDQMRHYIASVWDAVYNDTIGAFTRFNDADTRWMQNLRHNTANVFDGIRHDIASIWDSVWSNTVGRTERGVADVENWYLRLAAGIGSVLGKLPGQLYNIAKNALNQFLSGAKSIGGSIINWFKSTADAVVGTLKKVFGIASPSRVMYDIGRNVGMGLVHGLNSTMDHLALTSSGVGGNVVGWISAALKATGKPMSWLPALTRLVSKESGGNPRAVDPIPVMGEHAEGLFQTLPSTFSSFGVGGNIFNPIADAIAGIRYIASAYGSPFNIPGLLGGSYHGYASGGWIREPVLGVGMHSRSMYGIAENGPEYVGGGGGNVYITVQGDTDPYGAARRIHQSLRAYKKHVLGNKDLGFG